MIENKALVLDLVEWLNERPRPYAEAMEAWRTSCPRFPVWEDCVDFGFIRVAHSNSDAAMVEVTPAGLALLQAERAAR